MRASLIKFPKLRLSSVSSAIWILVVRCRLLFGLDALRLLLAFPGIEGTYGFPRFEHDIQTLNMEPSINTVFFPSVMRLPQSSQNDEDDDI